jgi:hypothetical protein
MSRFMSFKQIASKIANAIIGEIAWQLTLLNKSGENETFDCLLKEGWLKNLILASCFNVMIDTHVRKFFEEKMDIKNIEHSFLIFLGKSLRSKVVRALFERNFTWIARKDRDFILENYHEYVGANMLEKLIWNAYFVKKNSRKKENIDHMRFFKLSKSLFL